MSLRLALLIDIYKRKTLFGMYKRRFITGVSRRAKLIICSGERVEPVDAACCCCWVPLASPFRAYHPRRREERARVTRARLRCNVCRAQNSKVTPKKKDRNKKKQNF